MKTILIVAGFLLTTPSIHGSDWAICNIYQARQLKDAIERIEKLHDAVVTRLEASPDRYADEQRYAIAWTEMQRFIMIQTPAKEFLANWTRLFGKTFAVSQPKLRQVLCSLISKQPIPNPIRLSRMVADLNAVFTTCCRYDEPNKSAAVYYFYDYLRPLHD